MLNKITELEERLQTATEDGPERLEALNRLASELWTIDHLRAIELTREALELSGRIEDPRGAAYTELNNGVMHWRNDAESGLDHILEALKWFENNHDLQGEAFAKNILGFIYWGFGDFQRGFEYASQSLEIFKEIDEQNRHAWAHNTLGGFYFDVKDYQEALNHFQQADDIFKKMDDPQGQARSLNGIGNIYLALGDHEKALAIQKDSLVIGESIQHELFVSRALNDIGQIYRSLGELTKARDYHLQSLEIRQRLEYTQGATTSLLDLGRVHVELNQFDQAAEVLQRALVLSEKIKAMPKVSRALQALSQVHEMRGDVAKALQYHKRFHEVEEDVFHEDADKKLKNMKSAYQLEASQKEAEIFRLRNVELKDKNDELEQTIKKLNATQAQIIQSGKMVALGKLVAGIAHEINTPIGTIKSVGNINDRLAKKLMNAIDTEAPYNSLQGELQKVLQVLKINNINNLAAIERIIKIIESLKSFSKLDEADFQKADLHANLDNTLTLIAHKTGDSIEIEKIYGDLPEVYSYPNELNQVFMNLLMNAVEAMPSGGKLSLETCAEIEHVEIKISDTGKGIPAEKIGSLFEPGFSALDSRVKMRTGLYTSFSIINKHKGDLKVESEVGKGTSFIIRIPRNLNELIGT